MKQVILTITTVILNCIMTNAQNWTPLGSGTNNDVRAMRTYKGQLYVGGAFTNAGGVSANHIARWNGMTWDSVGGGLQGSFVSAMEVYNGELYVSGAFSKAGSLIVSGIAKWNGLNWDTVGPITPDTVALITTLKVFNGELYAGGYINTISNATNCDVAKWNGSYWTSMGITNLGSIIIDTFNLSLYVGGYGTGCIKKWDGSTWETVGIGVNGPVNSLLSYNSTLYIGGQFNAQDYNFLTKLDGNNFINVNYSGRHVYAMFNFNNELYVAGGGTQVATDNFYKWDDSVWTPLGYFNSNIQCLAEFNNELYVGGAFTNAEGIPANTIVKLSNLSGIENTNNDSGIITVYPNPSDTHITIIEFKNPNNDKYSLKLFTSIGQLVETIDTITANKIEIERNNFDNGLYFIQLWKDNQLIATEKLIIE